MANIQLFSFWCSFTSVLSYSFGLFVFIQGPRRKADVLWSLTCFAIGTWAFGIGMMSRAYTLKQALWWQTYFLYLGAIFIPVLFLHFVSILTTYHLKKTISACYAIAIIFQIFNFSGHFATIRPILNFPYYTAPLAIYTAYVVYFFSLVVCAFYLLCKKLLSSDATGKNQLKYIFTGTLIGFAGGSTTFLTVYDIPIFPYGMYLVFIYVITISYAIAKYNLMDISIVFRRTLIYSVLTITLTTISVLIVTIIARLSQGMIGINKLFPMAIMACVTTALFHPLQRKIQQFVDRRFFRESLNKELLREVTSGFVHEIKRPLAKISLPAELTLMDLEDLASGKAKLQDVLPEMRERLKFIMDQAIQMGYKIEAVRQVSTPENSAMEEVHVNEVIAKAAAGEKTAMESAGITFHANFSDTLSPIRGNAKQLEIVFANLIRNAVDAMMESRISLQEKRISISMTTRDNKVEICVHDTGPGIPTDVQKRLFQPHFSTKGAKGMGMGLYLAQQIIQAHGGSLQAQSRAGTGADFEIRLPIANQKDQAAA